MPFRALPIISKLANARSAFIYTSPEKRREKLQHPHRLLCALASLRETFFLFSSISISQRDFVT